MEFSLVLPMPTVTLPLDNFSKFFTDIWELRTIWITLSHRLTGNLDQCISGNTFCLLYAAWDQRRKINHVFPDYSDYLGTVLVAEGMLTFMGPHGWLNQFLMFIGLIQKPFQFYP